MSGSGQGRMRTVRWIVAAVIGVVFFVLLMQTYRQANRPEGYDFTSYLLSAKALWTGGDPYHTGTKFEYIYPLFLAFLVVPLSAIPYWLANLIWFCLGAGSFLFMCRAIPKTAAFGTDEDAAGRGIIVTAVVVAVLFSPLQNGFLNGQANLIVLFCCTMFLVCYRRGSWVAAAAWLGAAIAIKIVPGILVVFLLVRREYRIVAWTAVFAAFFCCVPAVLAGEKIVDFYRYYWEHFLRDSAQGIVPRNGMFFGLRGTLEYFMPAIRRPGAERVADAVRVVSQLISLSAIVAIDLAGRKSRRRDVWAFSTYLVGCLLLSPTAEIHHLVFAMPAISLLAAKTLADRRWATKTVIGLMAGFILCFDVAAKINVRGPFFLPSLVVLLVLVVLAMRDDSEATTSIQQEAAAG